MEEDKPPNQTKRATVLGVSQIRNKKSGREKMSHWDNRKIDAFY